MSDILIKGMEMPESGTYEVSIDSANGKDKTVMSLFVRGEGGLICCGVYELIPVPPHGRLIDEESICGQLRPLIENPYCYNRLQIISETLAHCLQIISDVPTIIPAEEGE